MYALPRRFASELCGRACVAEAGAAAVRVAGPAAEAAAAPGPVSRAKALRTAVEPNIAALAPMVFFIRSPGSSVRRYRQQTRRPAHPVVSGSGLVSAGFGGLDRRAENRAATRRAQGR